VRAAGCSAFLDIALVEPPQIIIQPLIGGANKLIQRVLSFRSLLLTALMRVLSTAGDSREVEPPAAG
jgi:hypothetical protein